MNSDDCVACRGTGSHIEFKCPICGSPFFGSISEGDRLKRYCTGSEKCRFQWMDYEDFKYLKPVGGVCIICNGSGKETLIGFDQTGNPSV